MYNRKELKFFVKNETELRKTYKTFLYKKLRRFTIENTLRCVYIRRR